MPEHYYTPLPQSDHRPGHYQTVYRGHTLQFETDSGVFSRTELDRGTEVLLNALPASLDGTVLDMGCGYGALGICVAKANPACQLTMADINQRAVSLAVENASRNGVVSETLVSDGFAALRGRTFDLVLTNPPIRAGKQLIYRMFADSAGALSANGALMLVIRKQQGAPSAQTYLKTLFAKVEIVDRTSGYWVLRCQTPLKADAEPRAECEK